MKDDIGETHGGRKKGYIFAVSVILLSVVLLSLLSSMRGQLKDERVAAVLREGLRTPPYLFDDVGDDYKALLPFTVHIGAASGMNSTTNVSISDAFPLQETPQQNLSAYESFFEGTFAPQSGYTLNLSTGINQSFCRFDNGMNYTRGESGSVNEATLLLGAANANEWGQRIVVRVNAPSTAAPTPMSGDGSGVNVTLDYRDTNNTLTQNILVIDGGAGKSITVPFSGGQSVEIYLVRVGSEHGMRVRASSALVVSETMEALLNTSARPSYTFENLTLEFTRGNVSRHGSIYIGG